MKEQLITFETAKLAKEKRFGLDKYLSIDDENPKNLSSNFNPREYQPWYFDLTQSLLQKWLREQFSLHIAINVGLPHNCPIMYYSNVIKFGMYHKSKFKSKFFNTYEEALEEGLREALKLI